ncbi:hypothetical protein FPANT_13274 [Fusarium pseudoanthophilum]|uniref:Uncharacterized protein n=1 Tax=Fusarium pseudoanthophilum TaxID=48495 RepID=A0A8H5KHR2_9HYPO|nr:hypothetical protein FPANT_13274 [Fusarium pseudoanthophilum]
MPNRRFPHLFDIPAFVAHGKAIEEITKKLHTVKFKKEKLKKDKEYIQKEIEELEKGEGNDEGRDIEEDIAELRKELQKLDDKKQKLKLKKEKLKEERRKHQKAKVTEPLGSGRKIELLNNDCARLYILPLTGWKSGAVSVKKTEAPTQITQPSSDRMIDKLLGRRKNIPSSTTHSETEKGITERFEKANIKIKKLEKDKEHVERRINNLRDGRVKVEEFLIIASAREKESKLKGREVQMKESGNRARWSEREIREHDREIKALKDMLKSLDGEQKAWSLELERLRDAEKMAQRLAAKGRKK